MAAAPLHDRKLRQLRRTLAAYGSCLDELPADGRRALLLRAGVGGRKPASRRVVARRLDVSPRRARGVEAHALRQLTNAGQRGLCGDAAAGAASGSTTGGVPAVLGSAAAGRWTTREVDERSGVLGASERSGTRSSDGGPSLDFVDRSDGAPDALLLLALAILGPLAIALIAGRSTRAGRSPRT